MDLFKSFQSLAGSARNALIGALQPGQAQTLAHQQPQPYTPHSGFFGKGYSQATPQPRPGGASPQTQTVAHQQPQHVRPQMIQPRPGQQITVTPVRSPDLQRAQEQARAQAQTTAHQPQRQQPPPAPAPRAEPATSFYGKGYGQSSPPPRPGGAAPTPASRAMAPLAPAAAFVGQRKQAAQTDLNRMAGPAIPFEKGITYPVYEAAQKFNTAYQAHPAVSTPPKGRVSEVDSAYRGIARTPGNVVEGAAWLLPASERAGQLLWRDPGKLPGAVSGFVGEQVGGLKASYREDPWAFAGAGLATAAIGLAGGLVGRQPSPRSGTPRPKPAGGGGTATQPAGSRMGALEPAAGAGGSAPAARPPRPSSSSRMSSLEPGPTAPSSAPSAPRVPPARPSRISTLELLGYQTRELATIQRPSPVRPTGSPRTLQEHAAFRQSIVERATGQPPKTLTQTQLQLAQAEIPRPGPASPTPVRQILRQSAFEALGLGGAVRTAPGGQRQNQGQEQRQEQKQDLILVLDQVQDLSQSQAQVQAQKLDQVQVQKLDLPQKLALEQVLLQRTTSGGASWRRRSPPQDRRGQKLDLATIRRTPTTESWRHREEEGGKQDEDEDRVRLLLGLAGAPPRPQKREKIAEDPEDEKRRRARIAPGTPPPTRRRRRRRDEEKKTEAWRMILRDEDFHWEFGAGATLPEAAAILFGTVGTARPRQPAGPPPALSTILGAGRAPPPKRSGRKNDKRSAYATILGL